MSGAVSSLLQQSIADETTIGSPLKKHRASVHDASESRDRSAAFPQGLGDVLARATADQEKQQQQPLKPIAKEESDEEL